ncbi:MAG: outer membrane protein assembly factor BamD [Nitrospiria bacterium]
MRFHYFILGLVLLSLISCAELPLSPPGSTATGSSGLEKAKTLFEEGKYGDAAALFRKLSKSRQKETAETAQFQLGRTLAFYKNPRRDYAEAAAEFQVFTRRFPGSPFKEEASNWNFILEQYLSKKSETDKLRADIKKLVDIDIGVEKKKTEIK